MRKHVAELSTAYETTYCQGCLTTWSNWILGYELGFDRIDVNAKVHLIEIIEMSVNKDATHESITNYSPGV